MRFGEYGFLIRKKTRRGNLQYLKRVTMDLATDKAEPEWTEDIFAALTVHGWRTARGYARMLGAQVLEIVAADGKTWMIEHEEGAE